MSKTVDKASSPFVLVVLDGWGVSDKQEGNAIALGNTPNLDKISAEWPHTTVESSGLAVGLPVGQVGNSEVGHQNIGAGRRVLQDYVRINEAIANGSFYQNEAFLAAFEHVKKHHSQLHIFGLLGNGGVHAHQNHLEALLKMVRDNGAERVFIHAFGDGRDTSPTKGIEFMKELETTIKEIGGDHPAKIATLTGRAIAMDRDDRWERTAQAYAAIAYGKGLRAASGLEATQQSYDKGVFDEYIEPTIIIENGHPVATVQDGDAIINFDFRPDRERQLTKAFILKDVPPQAEGKFQRDRHIQDLLFVTMTEYERGLPVTIAFVPDEVAMPLARVISDRGERQLHLAETEKYAHVTYFLNGRREEPYPGEERMFVPSPSVPSYDLKPEMSAAAVTDKALEAISSGKYSLIAVNYANGDMVGHTGVLDATVRAVGVVDTEIGKIVEATLAAGGSLLITADHGKAEQMFDAEGKPLTAHTLNPVPVYLISPAYKHAELRSGGILADVAPTVLEVMGVPVPAEMTGKSLIVES